VNAAVAPVLSTDAECPDPSFTVTVYDPADVAGTANVHPALMVPDESVVHVPVIATDPYTPNVIVNPLSTLAPNPAPDTVTVFVT
jgi:hypothetical protein